MNFRALEKLIESWKSPGNLFLKKSTNLVYFSVVPFPQLQDRAGISYISVFFSFEV